MKARIRNTTTATIIPVFDMFHLNATLDHFQVPAAEKEAVVGFVQSTKGDVVEVTRAQSVSVS